MKKIDLYRHVDVASKVNSASPYDLVSLLFERTLHNLNRAQLAYGCFSQDTSDLANKKSFDSFLENTIEVMGVLRESLDLSLNDELPHNLDRLYDYIQRRLLHARLHKDVDAVVECHSLAETLYSGWQGIGSAAPTL